MADINYGAHFKRPVRVLTGVNTEDGAGVKLRRVFGGYATASLTDPFLLLDHFGSSRVEDYEKGFPWHPHRGIETVTYLLAGKVLHEDSEGHRGVIRTNDLQWMTAGSGIFHQEMPRPLDETDPEELLRSNGLPTNVSGFQLWVNLPARQKMTIPTYRDIGEKQAPRLEMDGGAIVKVISGQYGGASGPVGNAYGLDPTYLDVLLPEESEFSFTVKRGYSSLIYMVTGGGYMEPADSNIVNPGQAAVFSQEGDAVRLVTKDDRARFLVLSGKPLHQPIRWYGPIVMNTQEQIDEAVRDLSLGTFIRDKNVIFEN
ncbi:MAG: pirin family protein [Nitrososphaerota archaeon]|nr:pirin family protein [Nitrososphaerota archaeon]MDG7039530.1 pirin family protein [Nitrososphaerota archaeon]MDG7043174.1 pirin family protein [Nitrososphaerota archaeon]